VPRVPFETLPGDARLWVFPSSAELGGEQAGRLLADVDRFLDDWRAHGDPLTVGRDWREGRFLFVAVDQRSVPPSGCSIDALARVLKGLEPGLGTTLTDHVPVFYRTADGEVVTVSRTEFQRLAANGDVTLETPVFDTTLTRLAALREGRFEVAAGDAWHRRAFFRDAVAR
jgi:hypothetical protein